MKESLESHFTLIHEKDKRTHKCHLCTSSYNFRHLLQRHINIIHSKIKIYKCSQCDESFTYKLSLEKHVKKIHKQLGSAQCEFCKLNCNSISKLQEHIKAEHKPFDCKLCDAKFRFSSALKGHITMEHSYVQNLSCWRKRCVKNKLIFL